MSTVAMPESSSASLTTAALTTAKVRLEVPVSSYAVRRRVFSLTGRPQVLTG